MKSPGITGAFFDLDFWSWRNLGSMGAGVEWPLATTATHGLSV
jgi:hypothetical protein